MKEILNEMGMEGNKIGVILKKDKTKIMKFGK